MDKLLQLLLRYKYLYFFYLPVITVTGIIGGLALSSIVYLIILFNLLKAKKYSYIIIIFFFIFILADNLYAPLNFFKNLRFVALGSLLLVGLRYTSKSSIAFYIIPFTIFSFTISLIFSPIWEESLLRTFAFLLSGLVIFGSFRYYFLLNRTEISDSLVLFFLILFTIPLILILIPNFDSFFFLLQRFRGIMGNPNGLALLSILAYTLLDLILGDQKIKKIVKIAILFSVVLSGSRNGISSILLYEIIKFIINRKLSFLYIIIASILIISINIVDLATIVENSKLGEYLRLEGIESGSGRVEVWKVIFEEIKTAPWTGKGLYYESYFLPKYVDENWAIGRQWYSVWNSYLTMLLNVGIIGSFFYFYFVYKAYLRSKIKTLALPFLIASLYSAFFESWLMASLNAFTPFFFLYFAIQDVSFSSKNQTGKN